MIKKLNIVLAILFAAMLGLKGLKEIKASRERDAAAATAAAPAGAERAETTLAPNVYHVRWAYFAAEDPMSNRNGVLLDTIRAIFPNATFKVVKGEVEDIARKLREDPHGVVVGFGPHPEFAGFRSAPTPMAYSKVILMTLRSNPWRYEGKKSLDKLRILVDSDFLDYPVIRERFDKLGGDSPKFRVVPLDMSALEQAALVEAGEADAFVASGDAGVNGVAVDTMSMRILQHFRKSDEIGRGDALLYVSTLDEKFAQDVLDAYEAGMRRIESSGERARIFDYYGMEAPPLPPEEGKP